MFKIYEPNDTRIMHCIEMAGHKIMIPAKHFDEMVTNHAMKDTDKVWFAMDLDGAIFAYHTRPHIEEECWNETDCYTMTQLCIEWNHESDPDTDDFDSEREQWHTLSLQEHTIIETTVGGVRENKFLCEVF